MTKKADRFRVKARRGGVVKTLSVCFRVPRPENKGSSFSKAEAKLLARAVRGTVVKIRP